MNAYGQNRDTIRDLLLFWSSKENKLTSLKEYVDRMPESQEKIYYVCADSVEHASKMPQAERVLKAGYEVLYLTVDEDEIVLQSWRTPMTSPLSPWPVRTPCRSPTRRRPRWSRRKRP